MLLGVTVSHDIQYDLDSIDIKDINDAVKGLSKKGLFIVTAE